MSVVRNHAGIVRPTWEWKQEMIDLMAGHDAEVALIKEQWEAMLPHD